MHSINVEALQDVVNPVSDPPTPWTLEVFKSPQCHAPEDQVLGLGSTPCWQTARGRGGPGAGSSKQESPWMTWKALEVPLAAALVLGLYLRATCACPSFCALLGVPGDEGIDWAVVCFSKSPFCYSV